MCFSSYAQIKINCSKEYSNQGLNRLEWIDPIGTCAPYEVYRSNDRNGTYTLIATVSDTFFVDGNAGLAYYYVVPTLCGSRSDTVDTKDPVAPVIESVSVNNDVEIVINWKESESRETMAYRVSIIPDINNPISHSEIDMVYGISNTSYTHSAASTYPVGDFNANPQYYTVFAAEHCNQDYSFGEGAEGMKFGTMLLGYDIDRCSATAKLSWTPYDGWQQGVANYVIHLDSAGGGLVAIDTISGALTTYDFPGLKDDIELCFTIEAISAENGVRSFSNQECMEPNVVQQPEYVVLNHVSVLGEGQIDIQYYADSSADIKSFNIYRRVKNGEFALIKQEGRPEDLDTLMNYDNRDKEKIATSIYIYEYQIGAVDSCGNEWLSNISSTMLLEGEWKYDFTNELDWNTYFSWRAGVREYEIWRQDDWTDEWESLDYVAADDSAYLHDLNDENGSIATRDRDGLYCYVVMAWSYPDQRDVDYGVEDGTRSQSNKLCIQQDPPLYVPNVFTPNGDSLNNTFKPLPIYISDEDYEFKIFDRWGKLVFETNDLNHGWDGSSPRGKPMPVGMYWYTIQFTNPAEKEGMPRRRYLSNGGRPSAFLLFR